jgi:hypothetical protein
MYNIKYQRQKNFLSLNEKYILFQIYALQNMRTKNIYTSLQTYFAISLANCIKRSPSDGDKRFKIRL